MRVARLAEGVLSCHNRRVRVVELTAEPLKAVRQLALMEP